MDPDRPNNQYPPNMLPLYGGIRIIREVFLDQAGGSELCMNFVRPLGEILYMNPNGLAVSQIILDYAYTRSAQGRCVLQRGPYKRKSQADLMSHGQPEHLDCKRFKLYVEAQRA